jgi:hypothetical protein
MREQRYLLSKMSSLGKTPQIDGAVVVVFHSVVGPYPNSQVSFEGENLASSSQADEINVLRLREKFARKNHGCVSHGMCEDSMVVG